MSSGSSWRLYSMAQIRLYDNRHELKRHGENARKRFLKISQIEKFTENSLRIAEKDSMIGRLAGKKASGKTGKMLKLGVGCGKAKDSGQGGKSKYSVIPSFDRMIEQSFDDPGGLETY